MGFAGLTAKKEGIELPPPKNNAQREHTSNWISWKW
jgi:hypothetical protein